MIIRNFLFHRVSDEPDALWPPMKPKLFTEVIKYLTRRYQVVPLEVFLNDPHSLLSSKKIATVLFDDGYKDNIEVAAPILKKYKCPGSFYIVTGCIDGNIPTWTYLIDNAFQKTKKQKLEFSYDFVPAKFKSVPAKLNASMNPVIKTIKSWMKTLADEQRLTITNAILDQCNDVPIPENKMMNWKDIRQLKTAEFIIGSHSHTHPLLASLTDESAIARELKTSAQRILQETGDFPETISYPIGSFDERVIHESKNAGYKFGLAVEQKFFYYPSDVMTMPRVELYQESWWKVKLHLTGNYLNRLKRIRN